MKQETGNQKDYCENCEEYINQVEIEEGVFGCPICKRDDNIITFYQIRKGKRRKHREIEFKTTEERDEFLHKNYPNRKGDEDFCGLYHIRKGTILVRLNTIFIDED